MLDDTFPGGPNEGESEYKGAKGESKKRNVARKYLIETYGCQMNIHDSERMAGLLEQAGYESTADDLDADVIVINTCSVREKAEEKLFTRLGEIQHRRDRIREPAGRRGRRLRCAAGRGTDPEAVDRGRRHHRHAEPQAPADAGRRAPFSGAPAVARRQPILDLDPLEDVSFPLGIARRQDPHKAYVTIIEGCNEFCAFCVVPYTRGKERMRPVAEIVADAPHAVASGAKEIQLLGQIVNHYQAPDDPACDFAGLLERLNDDRWASANSFREPASASCHSAHDRRHAHAAQGCRHLHLPVQSGSTATLRAMRRRHTREEYLELVSRLRDAMPDIALSTDIIVGFPGETAAISRRRCR